MNKFASIPILLLLVVATMVRAQKPARLQINSLIARVPIPESSSACYSGSSTTTDASGVSSVKDNGPVFKALQDELTAMMSGDMGSMQSAAPTAAPQAPTAEQIAQMQQDAMARAQALSQGGANPSAAMQAQASANRKPPATNPAIMQELGKASGASMQIQSLIGELSRKIGAVNAPIVHSEPNCPEVRQGSYVGPTCECTYNRSVTSEQKRVGAQDAVLEQRAGLMRQYLHQIEDQIAIIDKLESDAKYGEGITDQTVLSLLWSSQRQGLNGMVSFMSIASGGWSDGARVYADLVNAKANHCK